MTLKKSVDTVVRSKKSADAFVVVESVDDVRNVLTHINLCIPRSCKKLGSAVNEVCCEDLIEQAFLIRLIELLKAGCKETEGFKYEDSLCALLLDLHGNVDNGFAGSDHIVDDNNILACNIVTQILVSLDGISAVNHDRIVTALIEHTEE